MAPVTRSSQAGMSSLLREGSWQFTNNNDEGQDSEMSDSESGSVGHSTVEQKASRMVSPQHSSAQDFSRLQANADRVTRQAEEFARCLDKFVGSKADADSQQTWKNAQAMLKTFQRNAEDRAKSVSSHRRSRSSSKSRSAPPDSESLNHTDTEQYQQEANLWELLSEITQIQSPTNQANISHRQSKAFQGLNRYSSDSERWDAFLHADDYAQEATTIISWLQRTADASGLSIEDLTQDLRYRAERGDGIWSSGWLYTRETIKGQKRLRSYSQYIDPKEHPEITVPRKTDGVGLVTQLDPDAALRQTRERCEEDNFHEAANWVSCWELLRRGKNWSYVRDYWAQRHEEWHSASILGEFPISDSENAGDNLNWMKSYGSGRVWTLTCRALSGDDGIDSYEAAVYALLSSDIDRSMRVCQSVDDYLFVLLTASVLERYDRFCRTLDTRLQNPTVKIKNSYDPTPATESYERIRTWINNLRLSEKTKAEVSEPLKAIQAALICRNHGDFFATQGQSTAKVHQTKSGLNIFHVDPSSIAERMIIDATNDPENMRTLVHVQLILQALGYFRNESRIQYMDNNIISYMLWLQREGKVELIPLYASCLSPENAALALGQILVSVTEEKERDLIVGLLRKYNIPLPSVLAIMFKQMCPSYADEIDISRFCHVPVLGNGDTQHPRQLKIRTGITTEELTSAERNLIHCLEWHRWVDISAWDQCCSFATALIKRFVFHGRLSAARALVDQAGLQDLSIQVVQVDLSLEESSAEVSEADQSPVKRSPRAQPTNIGEASLDVQLMRHQAQTWRELEVLTLILLAFEEWAEVAEQTEQHRNDPRLIRKCKLELTKCLEAVQTNIKYCISPDWLGLPMTPDEAPVLQTIRTYYLPEILLAQTSVLFFAGHYLSRDHLAECMEVAVTIASTEGLAETVQEANRMRVLMDQLAGVSKSLLLANERGSKRRPKEGATFNVGIWQVKPDEVGLEREMGRAK